jgi:hypothetical protein
MFNAMTFRSKGPDPEYVIALAERLKQTRLLLERLEGEWEALFRGFYIATDDAEDIGEADLQSNVSLSRRIMQFLQSTPMAAFTSEEVSTHLNAKTTSVSSILSRLVREGAIEKRSFSQYGAKGGRDHYIEALRTFIYHELKENGAPQHATVLEHSVLRWSEDGALLLYVPLDAQDAAPLVAEPFKEIVGRTIRAAGYNGEVRLVYSDGFEEPMLNQDLADN